MTENIIDKLEEETKLTKLQEVAARACSESSLLFIQRLNEASKSGKINEEQLRIVYGEGAIYAVTRFWELYCENYPEIYRETCQHQEELKRKIN
ncbi:MAG: hypothetical protein AABX93_01615 [Nanoarchaeota archaeon]